MATPEHRYGQVCMFTEPDSQLPRRPDSQTIYIHETGEGHTTAVLRCPCGCGLRIELPLRPVRANDEADWEATLHGDGTASFDSPIEISPELCGSRFSIDHHEVRWQA